MSKKEQPPGTAPAPAAQTPVKKKNTARPPKKKADENVVKAVKAIKELFG